jgi:hypothetical protein
MQFGEMGKHAICSIIAHAVENWKDLLARCGDYGFENADRPQIAYLVRHFEGAFILWADAYPDELLDYAYRE